MKHIILFLALITFPFANSQTLIASIDLELQKPESRHQFLQITHPETKEFVVFAADKSAMYALRYNSALFFRDSIKTNRPNSDVDFMAGHSFDINNNPGIYWVSDDYKTIRAAVFNFESKQVNTALFNLSLKDERILGNFSVNGSYHLMAVQKDRDSLALYSFNGTSMEPHFVDLSSIVFRKGTNELSLNNILAEHPPQYIDNKILNPLVFGTAKTKYYVTEKELIFTFDHEPFQTLIVGINLETFIVSQSTIAQSTLSSGPRDSNSFLSGDELYQIGCNEKEINIVVKNRYSSDELAAFSANESSDFLRNSPYLQQTANQPARELKNTKRFLRMLSRTDIGLNVYNYFDRKLLTAGGTMYIPSSGNVIIGVAAGAGMVVTGGEVNLFDLVADTNLRTVYFEMHLNSLNRHQPDAHDILAVDKIQYFLEVSERVDITLLTPYENDFLLGYYLASDKKYVVRRFTDGDDE